MYRGSKYLRSGLIILAVAATPAVLRSQTNPAQSPTSNRPAFDVVSVKVHGEGPVGINLHQAGGHLSVKGFSLQQLMGVAYDMPSLSQVTNTIVGMPDWGISMRFDIDAETPGSPTVEQKQLMLQSLLADRFQLVVHRETRQLPIYALVAENAGKLGPQIHPHAAAEHCDASASAAYESSGPQHALVNGGASRAQNSPAEMAAATLQNYPCGHIVGGLLSASDRNQVWAGGRNVSMDAIAGGVGTMENIDRTVVNETELSGDFDFTVEWDFRADKVAANPSPTSQTEPLGDSLFEALRSQVGLQLKPQKGPVDVIVIDHVERPQQN